MKKSDRLEVLLEQISQVKNVTTVFASDITDDGRADIQVIPFWYDETWYPYGHMMVLHNRNIDMRWFRSKLTRLIKGFGAEIIQYYSPKTKYRVTDVRTSYQKKQKGYQSTPISIEIKFK